MVESHLELITLDMEYSFLFNLTATNSQDENVRSHLLSNKYMPYTKKAIPRFLSKFSIKKVG